MSPRAVVNQVKCHFVRRGVCYRYRRAHFFYFAAKLDRKHEVNFFRLSFNIMYFKARKLL